MSREVNECPWDIANVQVPEGEKPEDVILAIRYFVKSLGFESEFNITCFTGSRFHRIPFSVYSKLDAMEQVKIVSWARSEREKSTPKQIADRLMKKFVKNVCHTTNRGLVVIIGGNIGYRSLFRDIKENTKLEIIWIYPSNVRTNSVLRAAAMPISIGSICFEDLLKNFKTHRRQSEKDTAREEALAKLESHRREMETMLSKNKAMEEALAKLGSMTEEADAEKAQNGGQIDGNVVKALAPRQKASPPPKPVSTVPKRDADIEKDGPRRPRETSPQRKTLLSPRRGASPRRLPDSPPRRRPGSSIRRRGETPPRRRSPARRVRSPLRRSPIRRRSRSPIRRPGRSRSRSISPRRPLRAKRSSSNSGESLRSKMETMQSEKDKAREDMTVLSRRRPASLSKGRSPSSPPPSRFRSPPRGSSRRIRGSPVRRRSPPPLRRSPIRRRSRSSIRRRGRSLSRSISPRRPRQP